MPSRCTGDPPEEPSCTYCEQPFTDDDPPYVFKPTGKLCHRLCMSPGIAEAMDTLAGYEAAPWWKRTLVEPSCGSGGHHETS